MAWWDAGIRLVEELLKQRRSRAESSWTAYLIAMDRILDGLLDLDEFESKHARRVQVQLRARYAARVPPIPKGFRTTADEGIATADWIKRTLADARMYFWLAKAEKQDSGDAILPGVGWGIAEIERRRNKRNSIDAAFAEVEYRMREKGDRRWIQGKKPYLVDNSKVSREAIGEAAEAFRESLEKSRGLIEFWLSGTSVPLQREGKRS